MIVMLKDLHCQRMFPVQEIDVNLPVSLEFVLIIKTSVICDVNLPVHLAK